MNNNDNLNTLFYGYGTSDTKTMPHSKLVINNDAFIEILSGLKEGDIVYVQTSTSNTSQTRQMFPGAMGGGMSGGMSGMPGMGGGMPSGSGMRAGGGMMR